MRTLDSHVSPYTGPPETMPADPPPLCEVCDLHEPDGDECARCGACIRRAAMELDELLAEAAYLEQRAERAEQALVVERQRHIRAEEAARG